MYKKDFEKWTQLKSMIHSNPRHERFFRPGEIWWCSLGLNIGFEEDGKNELYERPVLVIKKFSKEALLIVPLTNTIKASQYYIPVTVHNVTRSVIISQIRLISPKRLQRRIAELNKRELAVVRNSIKSII
jgi:mRNA interferase MazF